MFEQNKLPEGPCKIWAGGLNNNGYGPHREIYMRLHGKLPRTIDVAHTCHTRNCINPDHLVPKTRSQNMGMNTKPRRKPLTPEQVHAIRELYATGKFLQREVGKLFGIPGATVGKVVTRMHHKNV